MPGPGGVVDRVMLQKPTHRHPGVAEAVILRHVADVPPHVGTLEGRVGAQHVHRARVPARQTHESAKQCALASPVGTHEHVYCVLRELEVHAVQDCQGAVSLDESLGGHGERSVSQIHG